MTNRCQHCGAVFPADETCTDRFHLTQSLEFERPAYFRVHHLSVPCYLLQHRHYSRAGWLATRRLLHDVVSTGLSQEETYRRSQALFGNQRRQWRFADAAPFAGLDGIEWSWTLADVRYDTAEHYGADVERWVQAVLADTAALVPDEDDGM